MDSRCCMLCCCQAADKWPIAAQTHACALQLCLWEGHSLQVKALLACAGSPCSDHVLTVKSGSINPNCMLSTFLTGTEL